MLVTGAARGMGRQLALQASQRRARIVAWDLDRAGLDDLAAELGDRLVTATAVDVTDLDSPPGWRPSRTEPMASTSW